MRLSASRLRYICICVHTYAYAHAYTQAREHAEGALVRLSIENANRVLIIKQLVSMLISDPEVQSRKKDTGEQYVKVKAMADEARKAETAAKVALAEADKKVNDETRGELRSEARARTRARPRLVALGLGLSWGWV